MLTQIVGVLLFGGAAALPGPACQPRTRKPWSWRVLP